MFKNIAELAKISSFIGLTTGATIFFTHTLYFSYDNQRTNWKDIAFVGCIGTLLASRVSVSGNPWSYYY